MTLGFDVFVQLVIAAITTDPCLRPKVSPFMVTLIEEFVPACSSRDVATAEGESCGEAATDIACFAAATPASVPVLPRSTASASRNICFASLRGTRSCGRLGPARLGSTVDKSRSSVSLNTGSGVSSVR